MSDIQKYLSDIGRIGGRRKVKKGFAINGEALRKALERSAETRRRNAEKKK